MRLRETISRALGRVGIDYRQMLTLLGVYLKQDLRSGNAIARGGSREYVTSNWSLLVVVLIYVLMGLSIGVYVFTGMDVFIFSVVALSFTLFIVALAVVAESGNVIFSESETDIIAHLPAAPRTIFAAKVLNLFLFTLLLTVAINFFPLILGTWAAGSTALFLPAHAVSAFAVALFGTTFVVATYGLLMRYVSRQRFDNIVAYCQVGLALLFILGFQLLPRVMDFRHAPTTASFHWYFVAYPPAWYSGLEMLLMGRFSAGWAALAGIGVVALALLVMPALRKVGSGYSSFISQLVQAPVGIGRARKLPRAAPGSAEAERSYFGRLTKLFLRRPAERAVFDLVTAYLRRNREIKVRLYPSLAYFIVFPVMALVTEGLPDPFLGQRTGFYSTIGAMMVCFVTLSAVEALIFSEHYQAGYILRVAPIETLGDVHRALRKAVACFVVAPGFVMLFLFYATLWRSPVHSVLFLAPWALLTPPAMLLPFLRREVVPLSRKYQKGQQSARNLTALFVSIIGAGGVGVLQTSAISGRIPYWLFISGFAITALLFYVLIGKLTLESKPLASLDDRQAAALGGELSVG